MESARGALPAGEVLAGPAASSKGAAGKERGNITVIRSKKEHGLICSRAACRRVQPSTALH